MDVETLDKFFRFFLQFMVIELFVGFIISFSTVADIDFLSVTYIINTVLITCKVNNFL